MLIEIGWALLLASGAFACYTMVGYPALLALWSRRPGSRLRSAAQLDEWPLVSISLPVYNEQAQLREVLDSVLMLDYPRDRVQILVISDASTDDTDKIVEEYAARGIELLRLEQRSGKTAAENAAAQWLRGDVIVNTDASVRIHPAALKHLVRELADPAVGVASGRDVSVAADEGNPNISEHGYVNYEMRIRALETRVAGIIGASGCFYAIRAVLHRQPLPDHLSRDFAAALVAREHGYRSVSVDDAICFVPRTGELHQEFRRKIRTMSRGMETLAYKRHLLNPFRYGVFAWMLLSHKVCRWLTPAALAGAALGGFLLAIAEPWRNWFLAATVAGALLAALGWYWPAGRPAPRLLALLASGLTAQLATFIAIVHAVRGTKNAAWEPTRREREPLSATRDGHAQLADVQR